MYYSLLHYYYAHFSALKAFKKPTLLAKEQQVPPCESNLNISLD